MMESNREFLFALGQKLKNIRKERNYSQEYVANYAAINKNYLSDLERGRRNPTLIVLKRLADFYNVSLSELLK